MPSITIKVSDKPASRAVLAEALEREMKAVSLGVSRTEQNIRRLLRALDLKRSELEGLDSITRTEANELKLIELEGELAVLKRLKDRETKLDAMEICD